MLFCSVNKKGKKVPFRRVERSGHKRLLMAFRCGNMRRTDDQESVCSLPAHAETRGHISQEPEINLLPVSEWNSK